MFKRDHKKKFNIKVEVDTDQKNVAYDKTNVCGDDISGKSKNCAVLIGSTNIGLGAPGAQPASLSVTCPSGEVTEEAQRNGVGPLVPLVAD